MNESKEKLISLGEYTIDEQGLDSLCWELSTKYKDDTIEIFILDKR